MVLLSKALCKFTRFCLHTQRTETEFADFAYVNYMQFSNIYEMVLPMKLNQALWHSVVWQFPGRSRHVVPLTTESLMSKKFLPASLMKYRKSFVSNILYTLPPPRKKIAPPQYATDATPHNWHLWCPSSSVPRCICLSDPSLCH